MQAVKNIFGKLSGRPRLRVLLIVVGLIVVFIIGMNLFSSGDSNYGKPVAPPSRITPISPTSKNAQPVAPSQQQNYEAMANRVQVAQTTQQIQSGKTLFSNVFDNQETAASTSSSDKKTAGSKTGASDNSTTANEKTEPTLIIINPVQAKLDEEKQRQQQQQQLATAKQTTNQMANIAAVSSNYASNPAAYNNETLNPQQQAYEAQMQQQQQQQLSALQQNMASQIQSMQQTWAMPKASSVTGSAASSAPPSLGPGGTSANVPVAIKAGTIMFAVMDTALNSDQPGTPVMATIVSGSYNGAQLLGTFNRAGDKLVVQFTQMSIKSQPASISIGTAYAIDSKTANNAVATSADNHYLLRYGMLFAASFLQGFGSAYQNYQYTCPPNAQNCTIINSNGTPNTTATTKTAMYQGFGQVGSNLSQVAAAKFNTPPTVTLAQGTGIGILFMNDVKIP